MKLLHRTPNRVALALWSAGLLLAVFGLPYLFPRTPTVSLSYQVGFNNRVAAVAYVCVALAFALSLKGRLGTFETEDRRLPSRYLALSVIVFESLLLLVFLHRGRARLGSEAHYFVDRLNLLRMGRLPYRQFEFAYGPLLLYPIQLLRWVFHLSMIMSYHVMWFVSWAGGFAMLYYILASLEIPSRSRGAVYLLLCLGLLPWILWEGLNYTPARDFSAAFLAIVAFAIWRKTRSAGLIVLVSGIAIALGFGFSAEQGMALAIGLPAFFFLLCVRGKSFPLPAALALGCLSGLVVAGAWRMHMLVTLRSFSHGGYNFPLLPSPANMVILAVYLCAIFFLAQKFLARQLDNNGVLLVLCGLPMLVAAFGRCDLGHLMSATPVWLVGLYIVYGHTTLRRVIVPLLWFTMLMPFGFWVHDRLIPPTSQPVVRNADKTLRPAPTDVTYYSPYLTFIPPDSASPIPVPLEEGYYSAMENLTTPEQMQEKLTEFREHAGMPWILPDVADAETPLLWDQDPHELARLEQYPFPLPPVRHTSLDASVLTAYIRTHCRPTDMGQPSDPSQLVVGFRVWNCHA